MTDQQLIDEGYKDGKKSFEYLSKQIMDGFDFATVHGIMEFLGWKWHHVGGKLEVPSIERLMSSAKELMETAYEKEVWVSSGGFTASFDGYILSLEFVLEEYKAE